MGKFAPPGYGMDVAPGYPTQLTGLIPLVVTPVAGEMVTGCAASGQEKRGDLPMGRSPLSVARPVSASSGERRRGPPPSQGGTRSMKLSLRLCAAVQGANRSPARRLAGRAPAPAPDSNHRRSGVLALAPGRSGLRA